MIRNLNQLSFQGFGSVLPERSPADRLTGGEIPRQVLTLAQNTDAPVYLCKSRCWLCCGSGTTTLSVSHDNKQFIHFYLDKPVYVDPGIYFSLAPFQKDSSVELASQITPELVGKRSPGDGFHIRSRLRINGLYTFFYQEKEQGFLFPGEAHSMLELTYVDQGTLHSVADGQDLLLEQGDMVLYAPHQWHMQYADIGVTPRFVTISFDADGYDLSALFNRKFQSPQRAVTLMQQMLAEQARMDEFSGDMILSLLTQMLLTLQRETDTRKDKLKASNSLHNENQIIRHAQQFISAHIRQKLSVPLVARMVDVSPSYLTALFHKHLQISPGEYIRRAKLQESKHMIRESNMNFTQIAAALQYSTVHHFSRQFKEKFGITPSEYAKSVR